MSTKEQYRDNKDSLGYVLEKRTISTANTRDFNTTPDDLDLNAEPVNFKAKFGDLSVAMEDLYSDFKLFVMNEVWQ